MDQVVLKAGIEQFSFKNVAVNFVPISDFMDNNW